jgi:hypothetical protein
MILANLTALIAVTAIREAPSQNRRSDKQPKGKHLQRTGAYTAALFYGSLLK